MRDRPSTILPDPTFGVREIRRVLLVSAACYLDAGHPGARAGRSLMEELARRGFAVEVVWGTNIIDHRPHRPMNKARLRPLLLVLLGVVILATMTAVAPSVFRQWRVQSLPDKLRSLGAQPFGLGSGAPTPPIRSIILNDRVTDPDLAWLDLPRAAPDLTHLYPGTQISDAGLAHLAGHPSLGVLDLSGSRVTGPGLVHMSSLPELRVLILDGTPITDAGLAHLAGLRHLTHLSLKNTAITDAGIGQLAALPYLQTLEVDGTAVTKTGIKKLDGILTLSRVDIWHVKPRPQDPAAEPPDPTAGADSPPGPAAQLPKPDEKPEAP